MRERLLLSGWAAAVIGASLVHDPRLLAAGIALAALAAGRRAGPAAVRAAGAVLAFAGAIALSWIGFALWSGEPPLDRAARTALRLVLRAFLLTYLTFGVLRRVDPARALAFSPALVTALTIVRAHARRLQHHHEGFRLAFESRTIGRAGLPARLRHDAATAASLLERALRESEEVVLAMESRGLARLAPGEEAHPGERPA